MLSVPSPASATPLSPLSASPHASHLRPSISPTNPFSGHHHSGGGSASSGSGVGTSFLNGHGSRSPSSRSASGGSSGSSSPGGLMHSNSISSVASSTPSRSASTSSQSSTASIPARPIRPPPIETRTMASRPEQVWGATSLREIRNALNAETSARGAAAASRAAAAAAEAAGLSTSPSPPEGRWPPMAPRGKSTGFVVQSGRRGSGASTSSTATARGPSVPPPAATSSAAAAPLKGPPVPEDFKFGEELGRGSYSVVLRGVHLASGRPFAIKILDKAHLVTHKKQRYAQVEVEALKRLSNAPPAGHRPSGSAGSTSSPTTMDLPKTPTRPKSRRTYSGRGGGDGECGGGNGDASGSSTLPTSDSMKTVRASPARSRTAMPMEFAAQLARAPTPRLSHPGTVKLAYSFQDSASLYFVLDLVPNGEILGLIRQLGSLALTPARHYAAEIVDAVGWMHDRGVLHRDLKPENILLDADWHIKIADFGSAKVFPLVDGKVTAAIGPSLSSSAGQSNERVSSHSMANTPKRSFVGTAEYVSPEVLLNEATSSASDVWAIGCIIYQLLAGSPPFRGRTEYLTFQKIKALEYTFPEGFDSFARDLIEQLLRIDPVERLSISDIKAHPFFAGVDFPSLWSTPVPPRESGLVSPPEPHREDWFAGLGFGIPEADGEDDSEDEMDPYPTSSSAAAASRPEVKRRGSSNVVEEEDEDDARADDDDDDDDGLTPLATQGPDHGGMAFSDDDELEHFDPPPRGRWNSTLGGGGSSRANHGNGPGSASSGSTSIASTEPGTLMTPISGFGSGQPWSGAGGGASGGGGGSSSDEGRGKNNTPVRAQPPPMESRQASETWASPVPPGRDQRSLPLLPDETPLFSSPVILPSSAASSFAKSLNLGSRARERLLVLTDFPRLLCVKLDPAKGTLKVKSECLVVRAGSAGGAARVAGGVGTAGLGFSAAPSIAAGGGNVLKSVKEKGARAFSVQTTQTTLVFQCEDEALRNRWLEELRRVQE